MSDTPRVHLKPGRERSPARRHPWVFSGAIERVEGTPAPGDVVEVVSGDGAMLGRGGYSPASQIALRMWTFEPGETVTPEFLRGRLERAVQARLPLVKRAGLTACRLVYAESDGLPGLIVDRYGEFLVCQFAAAAVERWRREIAEALRAMVPCVGVYERSDLDVRAREGLEPRAGVLLGDEPPDAVEIAEGACRFLVDVKRGQKTGFFLDQRENRAGVALYAQGREVLNAYAYTGGFGVTALRAGAASVTNVDTSADALALARRNAELNGLDAARFEAVEASVPALLRRYRDSRRAFDLIVLDPPKFADAQGHVEAAARGYKDINLLAFKLLRPGGILATFSCSGHVDAELFQKIVADAALDARREAQILCRLSQPEDHPVSLAFPEGAYLKGLICRAG